MTKVVQHRAANDSAAHHDPVVVAAAKAAARARKRDDSSEAYLYTVWEPNEGAALEASLEVDPETGMAPIRLVDARFLVNLSKADGMLVRRQDLPEEAFINLKTLKFMSKGYMKTDLRILCLSYPWLTPYHPDPRGDSLKLLAAALDVFCRDRFDGGAWAVFIDYCSLPQLGPRGEPRTPAEAALLERGLSSLASLFSHPCTWTLKLTQLPADFPAAFEFPPGVRANAAAYDERGWCWTEASVSNLVKPYTQVLDLSRFTGSARLLPDVIRECRAGRAPPLTPSAFNAILESKAFTWKDADLPRVRALYKAAFEGRFARAAKLSYIDLGWGDADVEALCGVIEEGALRHTASLSLVGNQLSDAGMRVLAASLGRDGVAPELQTLELSCNAAGDAACAEVLASLRSAQLRERDGDGAAALT